MQKKSTRPVAFMCTTSQTPIPLSSPFDVTIQNKTAQAPQGRGPAAPAGSRRLHRKQAAVYLGVSLSWLDKARAKGTGPAYIEIGARVVYDLSDLDDFLLWNRRDPGRARSFSGV